MPLGPGTRLGTYEIVAALGAGGMGEVYRARDTKLGRDVALKLLPDSFAGDADRVARFRREAHVLAALNHPNIGAIYGLEEAPAGAGHPVHFLVLELVEAGTLAETLAGLRAKGSRLPIDEALDLARQIAEALEAAHDRGVIHRDLKPANIALTAEGRAKVLDFGLAKALDPAASSSDLSHSPTLTFGAAQVVVASVTTTPSFVLTLSPPIPSRFTTGAPSLARTYDIMPDGSRFIGTTSSDQSASGSASVAQINVVLNWFEELRQRAPVQ